MVGTPLICGLHYTTWPVWHTRAENAVCRGHGIAVPLQSRAEQQSIVVKLNRNMASPSVKNAGAEMRVALVAATRILGGQPLFLESTISPASVQVPVALRHVIEIGRS